MTPASLVLAAVVLSGTGGVEPEAWRSSAEAALAAGDTAAVLAAVEPRLQAAPNDLAALVLLARAQMPARPDLARLAALKALRQQLDPTALDLLTLSFERARAAGVSQSLERQLRTVEVDDYRNLLDLHGDHADLLYRLASQRLALERLLPSDDHSARWDMVAAALADLELARSLLPANGPAVSASVHYQSGRAHKHLGDLAKQGAAAHWQRARAEFEAALQDDPNRIDAIGELVQTSRALAQLATVEATIRHHLARVTAPWALAKLHAVHGNLLLELGRPEAAAASLDEAIKLDPSQMDAWLARYRIALAAGDDAQALAILEQATNIQPNFLLGQVQAGQRLVAAGRQDEARARFRAALTVPADQAVVLGMLPSRNRYRAGLFAEAATWLAWLELEHFNNPEAALQAAARAMQEAPASPYLSGIAGWALYHKGDFEAASKQFDRADVTPENQYRRAEVFAALGNHSQARELLGLALGRADQLDDLGAARALQAQLDQH